MGQPTASYRTTMKNMTRAVVQHSAWVGVLCGSLLLPRESFAGKGSWNLSSKVVDLHLYLSQTNTAENLQFSATDSSKLSYWFNQASKSMWNATEGHLRIGTVYVYNKSRNGQSTADIEFLEGKEAACANVNGLGANGTRMSFWMPRAGGNFDVPDRFTQNSMVHEFGHYGFGLYDEYLGHIRASQPAVVGGVIDRTFLQNPKPGAAGGDYWGWNGGGDAWMTAAREFYSSWSLNDLGSTDVAWTSSIMDLDFATHCSEYSWDGEYPYNLMITDPTSGKKLPGHSVRLPAITTADRKTVLLRAGTYWVSTEQEEKNGESCWATVARKLNISNPTHAPSTSMPAGFADINWVIMAERRAVELCIDRSGSMDGYPMEQAKAGAKLFANLAQIATATEDGDFLGVVDFDDWVTVTAAIRELTDETKRNQVLSAIDTLYARDMTSIGGGLNASRQQIESVGAAGAGEMIVLLSDGGENTSPWVSNVLPSIIARGIKVYTISLGYGASLSLMQSIADQTHGKHYIINDPADLQAAYAEINQQTKEATTASMFQSVLAPGAQMAAPVTVNSGAQEVTFLLTSEQAGMGMALRSPSGVIMNENSHPDNVQFVVSGTSRIIKVQNPTEGIWSPMVSAPGSANAITYAKAENPAAAIPDGKTLTRTITVTNSGLVNSIYPSVSISHQYVGDLKISLKSPKGTTVVLYNHTGGGSQTIQGTYGEDLWPANSMSPFIGTQMKGNWQLIIEDNSVGDVGTLSSWGLTFNSSDPKSVCPFSLLTSVQDDRIVFSASVETPTVYYPAATIFHASVNAKGPVVGANIAAVVTHPDGETQTIVPLSDDGNAANGDQQGGDGIYSAAFSGFTQSGTYHARIIAECTNGFIVFSGNSLSTNTPAPIRAPKFIREDNVGFTVSGVPNPVYNAVQVKTLSVAKKTNSIGNLTVTGVFNADNWQYNPKADGISFAVDGYWMSLSASQLKQKGRTFQYTYSSPSSTASRTVTVSPYVGGTSKCTYSITVKNDNLASINYSEATPEVDFSFTGGSISDRASLLVTAKAGATGSSAAYKALANGEVAPALYVQSATVKRTPRKSNQDSIQFLAGMPGWTLPSSLSSQNVSVKIGGVLYSFPQGSLVKQRDSSYKASLNGGKTVLVISPEKRLIQLIGKNQNLGAFSNPAEVTVTIGGQTQVARLTFVYNAKTTTYTY